MMQGQLEEHQGGMEIAREAYNKAVSNGVFIYSMPFEASIGERSSAPVNMRLISMQSSHLKLYCFG